MNILIKYLSLEAIENTVTCINYQIDKAVFFGRKAIVEEEDYNISSFLSKYLNCESEFITIDNKSFSDIEQEVKRYIKDDVFFDFTGDEGIFEGVSFKVANELDIPVHTFDIRSKETITIRKDRNGHCIEDIKRQVPYKLSIRTYIEMIGGYVIENDVHRGNVNPYMIELRKKMGREEWVTFCSLLSRTKKNDENYFICYDLASLINENHFRISKEKVISTIKELNRNNIIEITDISSNSFDFECEENIWLLTKAGTILEQIVYLKEKNSCDDSAVSLSFSWDRERHYSYTKNEIDVVCLNGYQLRFISCKDRKIERDHIYELEAVGRGFVGNYIKMKLVTTDRPASDLIERGKKLGIEIEYLKLNND